MPHFSLDKLLLLRYSRRWILLLPLSVARQLLAGVFAFWRLPLALFYSQHLRDTAALCTILVHLVQASHLESTLPRPPATADSNRLRENLNPLESTPTKNRGRGSLWLIRKKQVRHPLRTVAQCRTNNILRCRPRAGGKCEPKQISKLLAH
jgi:hypothetical protein